MGLLAGYYAHERGRKQWVWFFIGLLLGILGLILLFLLPRIIQTRAFESKKPLLIDPPPPAQVSKKFWYYLDAKDTQFGPMSFEALQAASKEGKISSQTYVWNEDLPDWQPFGEFNIQPLA